MTDLDTLLRDALDLQAGRAPHPDAVRAGLDARLAGSPHRARTRRVLVPAAAAVVAAGVVAGVSVRGVPGPREPRQVTAPPASASAASAGPVTGSAALTVPLRWSPTKLPAGWREVDRTTSGDGVQRTWRPGPASLDGDDGGPRLDFALIPAEQPRLNEPTGDPVTVNGRPGYLLGRAGDKLVVEWELTDDVRGLLLAIGNDVDAKGLLAIAASVRPDAGVATFPLTVDGLTGPELSREVIRNGPQSWLATVAVDGVVVRVGTRAVTGSPGPEPTGSRDVTVDGHPARFLPVAENHPEAELVVQLPKSRFLVVTVNAPAPAPPAKGGTATGTPPASTTFRPTLTSLLAIAHGVRWSEPKAF